MSGPRQRGLAASAVLAGTLALPAAAAAAQTGEEMAGLLWLGIEDGAEMAGERAERISTSPAVYNSVNPATKEIGGRITVSQRTPCLYRFAIEPVKERRDIFGDPVQKIEWEVSFSRVTGLRPFANDADLFMYDAEDIMCCELDGTPCKHGFANKPWHAPPTERARKILAQFQQNVCRPTK